MSSSASSSSSSASSSSSSSASASATASSSSAGGSANSSSGGSASSSSSGGISSRTIVAIATSTVIGVILLILIVLLIIKFIRKNVMKESTASDSNIKEFFQSLSTAKRFTSKELIEITSNYAKELGAGGFGRVYEGKLKLPNNSQMPVAVKVLNSSLNSSVKEQFIAEIGSMWRANHINLVELYGFCYDAKMKALVYEYMENGSLDGFLSGKKGWLEMDKLQEIAVGTARGIRYLHEECRKMIIHFDIKPGNVLLTKDLCAKVGDFGLAELTDRETTIQLITHGRGTPGFSAPELLAFNFTHKSDVYSFGMLLFEIVGSRRIKDGKQGEREDSFQRWVWDKISNGEVGRIVSECGIAEKYSMMAERMCRVALMCIRHQPDTRPSMSSVLKMLEGDEEIGATVNPFIRKNIMEESTASDSIIKEFFQSLSTESPKRFTSKEVIEITSNYAKELGAGRFGRVYQGKLKLPNNSQMLVAVKVLNGSINSCVEEQFIAEVGTMWRTNHINLVKLYGFCFDPKMKALMYEYMENGSLDGFLSGKKGWLEMDKLHEISVGTAKGIRYLHEECHKMIIHFDIKPGNVLLTKDLCAKVGDFGLAELMDRETTIQLITHGRGTPGFSAPEILAFNFTHKSDVYSFGMLLFEIVGSRRVKDGKQGEREDSFPRWVWDNISKGDVGRIVSECGIAEKYIMMAETMCRVALMCIRHQPDTRPSMSSVLKMLDGEEEIGATVNPFNSLVSSISDPKSEMSVGDYQPSETSS